MTDQEVRNAFSKNLANALLEQDITVTQLITKSGISKTTIFRYLRGETSPKLEDLEKIADALGMIRYQLLIF